jgi:hypothetical protein
VRPQTPLAAPPIAGSVTRKHSAAKDVLTVASTPDNPIWATAWSWLTAQPIATDRRL